MDHATVSVVILVVVVVHLAVDVLTRFPWRHP
jgi:hypothetical protein